MDLLACLRTESETFLRAARAMDLDAAVATCPGWTGADLVWHLTEVQHFWASIVERRLSDPELVDDPVRPDPAQLAVAFERESARLVAALGDTDPDEPMWSWSGLGGTAAWVLRRQAHEALIHRVDAESVVGSISPIDPDLAVDGIDEVLTVMLDASDIPDWGVFERIGRKGEIRSGRRAWAFEMGRLLGTSPDSGITYDSAVIRLGVDVSEPEISIEGPPDAMDLWLWGRGSMGRLIIRGDRSLADFVRDAAREGTQ